ncbi:hypothetical protein, partial [Phycicoccus sp.]|uniref:hypothetical protein n=1 Tax=Phycicoccus sp. TaxID=1902410 RepID=UPI002C32DCD8
MAARLRTPGLRPSPRAPSASHEAPEVEDARRDPDARASALRAALRRARVQALLGSQTDAPAPVVSGGTELDLEELVARTASYFAQSIQETTRKTYARRWRDFDRWCGLHSLTALPAASETVMLYLVDSARHGVSLSTIRGWVSAINRVHLEAGYPAPSDDPAMTTFLRGISRVAPRGDRKRVAALRISDVRTVCRHLRDLEADPVTVRDLAILHLSQHGMSDGAIARLDWDDVAFGSDAMVLDLCPYGRLRDRSVTIDEANTESPGAVKALHRWQIVSGGGGAPFPPPPPPPP